MLSDQIKQVMRAKGLSQKALAEALGVNLQRVKNLTAGNVHKLNPDEARALVTRLHVRADWLVTGEGAVFQTPQEQELERRQELLRDASKTASTLKLSERHQAFVRDILVGAALKQSDLLRATINGFLAEHATELQREDATKAAQNFNVQIGQVGAGDIVDNKRKKSSKD